MNNLTIKQLRYFEALARERHFGRAAEASAISQPALSMQIKELETSLGTPLFERGARQVRLTRFGEDFALRVRDILIAVDELADLARATGDRLQGRLRLGVIPTIAPYLLPRLLPDLQAAHEGLDIHVRETLTPRLIDEISDGRLDMAIVALPVNEPALTEVALGTEPFVLVRPMEESDAPVPGPASLASHRLLLLEEGHCFRDQALSFCSLPGAPKDGLDGSSLSTLVQMVGAGLGITLIPEMAIPVEVERARVSIARFSAPEPSRTIGMIWRRSSPLVHQFQEVVEVVRQSLETVGTEAS
ncbi:hydrogen peroxide-inducible genes activator [Histidinibacterium aquaticum]|uniref:LysR family transcriptional regulator n=1 Tax=Histidinibacterium aquaticum TaxID=2613962 RepID=A0A5J5GME9_9RHOB|nr:hydrogen peroxide-inducible genes activator [Histidinibacterium aquaticum]KAA9009340.1 LysR family transcriptional regulator [Histidinibacterium aquaticum]